jgi:hypothetical protein
VRAAAAAAVRAEACRSIGPCKWEELESIGGAERAPRPGAGLPCYGRQKAWETQRRPR